MTHGNEQINLTAIRYAPVDFLESASASDLLALVEAVEAAQELVDDLIGTPDIRRLNTALARFSFGSSSVPADERTT